MVFNSLPFLVFVLAFFLVWARIKKYNQLKWIWIILMSFIFYAWWDWRFLFILIFTGLVDYVSGKKILNQPSKKFFWLWLSLGSNILSLVFFKYSGWITQLLDDMFKTNFHNQLPEFSLVVPVGISFYTFNSMSYTIDLYRGKTKPAENLLHFFAFISFFPHLVAGPIIRAKDILGQLTQNHVVNNLQLLNGVKLCVWGFFQKMVLADNLAIYVNDKFSIVSMQTDAMVWWICMLAFSFQIYFDFNGYSTIARGLAKLCGIHLKLNFNNPFLAHSFQNFWQRWHISLSSFFRDYVYKSIGGNKISPFRTEINKWLTMLISGLWHGANLTFLFWGGIHAMFLSLERLFKTIKIPRFLSVFVVFIGVLLAWVFFRASTIHDAFYVIKTMFRFNTLSSFNSIFFSSVFVWLIVSFLVVYTPKHSFLNIIKKNTVFQIICWSLLILSCVFLRGPEQQFIYFQF
ncbi:MAG: MBOAT family O-acyltransferase [Bacteroidota bacterium]|nr:MBOAT family O-acyltransferase [Bacteroidota bacterium]